MTGPLFLSSAGHKSTRLLIAKLCASFSVFITNRLTKFSSGDAINRLQMGRKSVKRYEQRERCCRVPVLGRKMQRYTPLNIQFDYSLLADF